MDKMRIITVLFALLIISAGAFALEYKNLRGTIYEGSHINNLTGNDDYECEKLNIKLVQVLQSGASRTSYTATLELYDEDSDLIETKQAQPSTLLENIFLSNNQPAFLEKIRITKVGVDSRTGMAYIKYKIKRPVGISECGWDSNQSVVIPTPTIPANIEDDDPSIGSASAPVTIVEFSDYSSPFSRIFSQIALPAIKTNFIDTGKVKYVYRDYPLSFYPLSQKASEAAECADDQGKFWQMHDKLFQNQGSFSTDKFKSWATDLGLNSTTFNQCLDSNAKEAEVKKDMADGTSLGISGTPSFFINGKLFVGSQPYESFKSAIEEALKNMNTQPSNPGVSAFVASASADNAGSWNNFGEGTGYANKTVYDWEWAVDIYTPTKSPQATIKSISIRQDRTGDAAYGEAWSTKKEDIYGKQAYPLVVFKSGSKLNYEHKNDISLKLSAPSTHLRLFGQIETEKFYGGTLTIEYTDGRTQSAYIPGSGIRPPSGADTKLCLDSDGNVNYYAKGTVFGREAGFDVNAVDYCTGNILREYSCGTNPIGNRWNYTWVDYGCPNGCSNGACIPPTSSGGSGSGGGGGSRINSAPVVSNIPSATIEAGTTNNYLVDLWQYVSDEDQDSRLSITLASQTGNKISCRINSNRYLACSANAGEGEIQISDQVTVNFMDTAGKYSQGYVFVSIREKQPSQSHTVVVDLQDAENDFAGYWDSFKPGLGNANKIANDWHWILYFTPSEDKTIKSITIKHDNVLEGWSTSSGNIYDKKPYPLVVFQSGNQLNKKYDQQLGTYTKGYTNRFDMYGQIETQNFSGASLEMVFIDGTSIKTEILASTVKPAVQNVQTASQNMLPEPVLGNTNAPVKATVYFGFKDPFSKILYQNVLTRLVKDHNNVQVEFTNHPLSFQTNSTISAIAGECANEQGKFNEFISAAFAGNSELGKDELKSIAVQADLNLPQFNSCLDSEKYSPEVNDDLQKNNSVSGTPTTVITNITKGSRTETIVGAQSYEVFAGVVQTLLSS